MRNIPLWIGSIMLLFLIFMMFFGTYLPFIDKDLEVEVFRRDEDGKLILPPYEPSLKNLLGTDQRGVDTLSRIVVGAKETVFIVFAIAAIRYLIAVPLGIFAYKQKGAAHWIVTGLNQLFSSLPTIFSAVLLVSLPFLLTNQHRLLWVILLLASIEIGRVAYIIQQHTYKISREPFVEAGIAIGNSPWNLYRRYYLPSLLPEIIINFCIDLGKVMLLIGQMGALNVFLSQEWVQLSYGSVEFMNTSQNWATLLASHRADIYANKFSFIFYPAFAIMYVILTFNILSEGLRRHFNRRVNVY